MPIYNVYKKEIHTQCVVVSAQSADEARAIAARGDGQRTWLDYERDYGDPEDWDAEFVSDDEEEAPPAGGVPTPPSLEQVLEDALENAIFANSRLTPTSMPTRAARRNPDVPVVDEIEDVIFPEKKS